MADETPEHQLARIIAGPLTPAMQKVVDEQNAKMRQLTKDALAKTVKDIEKRPSSKFK